MKPFRSLVVATALVTLAGGIAYTADQTILGRVLTLKNKQDNPNQRRAIGRAKEKNSANTIVGNPTVGGATLTVAANGASPSAQTFTLPAAGWAAVGATGYKYKDSSGTFGAVKRAIIKRSSNGAFLIKAVANGNSGPVTVLPPNPGTDGCFALGIVGGDTYHVLFDAGSKIRNKGANLFQAKRPPTEGLCSSGSTTTSSTVVTTTTSTTTTTIYGSPSRAFLQASSDLLD
jgi:hypothetical protein